LYFIHQAENCIDEVSGINDAVEGAHVYLSLDPVIEDEVDECP
jgi:hypothetical protein